MKLSQVFQVARLSGFITLASVTVAGGGSVPLEELAPESEEDKQKLLQWYDFLDTNPHLKANTLIHLHQDQDFVQEHPQRARAAALAYRSLRRGDIRDDHPFVQHVRRLKDKTEDMFEKETKSTKAPTGCKSTKAPKSGSSSKVPKDSTCEDTTDASSAPSFLPSGQPSSSSTPSISQQPSSSSNPSALPSLPPSQSNAPSSMPSVSPSESSMPSALPSHMPSQSSSPSTTPSIRPSESSMPSALPSQTPSKSGSPSSLPSGQPSALPSGQPSLSLQPSSQPSSFVFPGCIRPNVTKEGVCFTGNSSSIADDCAVQDANCCTGTNACNFGNGTVCSGSCNGIRACNNILDGAYIEEGSCNGNQACENAAGGGLVIGQGSCNCDEACDDLGKNAAGSVSVGPNSCNGPKSCFDTGFDEPGSVSIGYGSCNFDQSCRRASIQSIGDDSCNGNYACYYLGFGPKESTVGNSSCNPNQACREFGGSTSVTTPVSVGNSACNVNVSQCSGETNTGGSAACYDASGTYGYTLPNNAVGC